MMKYIMEGSSVATQLLL